MRRFKTPIFLSVLFFSVALSIVAAPQRIVSLTPCATDILCELGISRELVGVTRYCKVPSGSSPRVIGGLTDPSAETVLAFKPDLLVHADIRDKSFLRRMSKHGIAYVTLFPESYANIKRDILLLGEKTERRERANAILKEWEDAESSIRKSLRERPLPHPPRVLIFWGGVCAGSGSYLNDAIELCGGTNAVPAGTARAWPQLTKEMLIATRADLLIYVTQDGPAILSESPELSVRLKKDPGFSLLPAVRQGKVFSLNENSRLLYPSPLLRIALPQLAKVIRRCAEER